ncbi:MAG TPA: LuxR C-terminal-related transcriptional regulator [Solirubrobacteraceae bacterium]|nr:LuxR C-terminal-related transcriptional regulator [Solirubrobacteraceae bacterium]
MPEDSDLAIEQALASCSAGAGQTVLFSGPSGRGISRRLTLAADLARDRGLHVATARGRPAERSLAFSIAVELFEPLWRASSSPGEAAGLADGPAGAAIRLLDSLSPSERFDDGGYAVTRGMWTLCRHLAEQPSPAGSGRRTPRAARVRGLAIVVDDLHDVDGPTLGLLAYAANRLEASPVTILAGHRIDVESRAPAAVDAIARAARVVVPEPLSGRAGAALVGTLLPRASARFAGACVTSCGGNPALLQALVVGLAGFGLSGADAEADRVGTVVPDELASLVTRRLSRLPRPARALADAVAASDRPVTLEEVATSAGLSADAALEAFDALITADVLLADPQPAFAQPIVRLAVRAALTPAQRARLASLADGPPGAGSSRLNALTPSEGRVADLAAHGMTTRQVAETLFVTPKTVEFHLRNVYAKLEIPSTRAALARALSVPDR